MFSSFKLPTFRPRSNSFSSTGKNEISMLCKPPKTPVGSPKQKRNRRSFFRRANSESESGPPPLSPSPKAKLRSGSVALEHNPLAQGDVNFGVNGINAVRMRPCNQLENTNRKGLLELEYSLPKYGSQNSLNITSKTTEITLERVDGSIGITLRGGVVHERPNLSRPLIITQIKPNGPAARTGLIRVGDRILKVDHHSLANKSLIEAHQILRDSWTAKKQQGIKLTTLTIEYDVSAMTESVRHASGPLLVEIDRHTEEDFGLVLTNLKADESPSPGFYVEHVIPASTADRCGALGIGDKLLAIDDLQMVDYRGTPAEAEKLLRCSTKLQILSAHLVQKFSPRSYRNEATGSYFSPSFGGYSTISSRKSRGRNKCDRQSLMPNFEGEFGSTYFGYSSHVGVCHPETLMITLFNERNIGYGLSVTVGEISESGSADIVITRVIPDTPAYRSGCIQVGDRVLSINHQSNLTLQEINSILEKGISEKRTQVTLEIEFDVADTIVPTVGVFTVKLAKKLAGLGITITASKNNPDDPFVISEIRRGSIAHRTGTLQVGDRLLAIDNRPLDHLTVESAFDILHSSPNDIVTLKIEKVSGEVEPARDEETMDTVVYTVELQRTGGPLGITISGSEDSMEPIVLTRLTQGGIAERTGALRIGDQILAINGEDLVRKRLSDAIRLLQTSGDRIQLKIARNLKSIDETLSRRHGYGESSSSPFTEQRKAIESGLEEMIPRCNYPSPGLISIDSAVHSWDSNHPSDNPFEQRPLSDIQNDESSSRTPDVTPEESPSKILNEETCTQTSEVGKHDSQLQFYSDTEDIYCPSPLPLPNYNYSLVNNHHQSCGDGIGPLSSLMNQQRQCGYTCSSESILACNDIIHVTLYKDTVYDDYGFSLSDGLYEKGVYVNKIRKDGPADIVGLLRPYDRIIQVNNTKTIDFDCCLTVPLIAAAGDRIELVIARSPYANSFDMDFLDVQNNLSASLNTITKTL